MLKRYAIWNKKDDIKVPTGKVYTAKEWMDKYPIAKREDVIVVCGAGDINGSYFGILDQMVSMYEKFGVDFSKCKTDEDKLKAIEDYEDKQIQPIPEPIPEENESTPLERIAAALEYQNLLAMDVVNPDDPEEI